MDFSKLKNKLLILLCCFVVIFPFCCVAGLCAELEPVEYNIIDNLTMNTNNNYFTSADNRYVGYFQIEKGYIYYIENVGSGSVPVAQNNNIPSVNGVYDLITSVSVGDTYSFIPTSNNYIYLSFTSRANMSNPIITREKLTSMDGAVSELVQNVGIDSIWNIFDISINYIVIVVLVAFGLFVIFRVIRKVSKGKEGL